MGILKVVVILLNGSFEFKRKAQMVLKEGTLGGWPIEHSTVCKDGDRTRTMKGWQKFCGAVTEFLSSSSNSFPPLFLISGGEGQPQLLQYRIVPIISVSCLCIRHHLATLLTTLGTGPLPKL